MSAKKIIAVVGATGNQGGAVVEAILKEGVNGVFAARAITRNASLAKAQELKKRGAELAEVDINDTEALTKAIAGCYGMFCVTALVLGEDGPAIEIAQATSMATAAKNAGIKHVVWSTLDDARSFAESANIPMLYGKYKVPHFEAKAEGDKIFAANVPTTCLLTSFFWDNLLRGMAMKKTEDNKYVFTIPMGKKTMAGIGAEDIGKCALGIFKRPDLIGKYVGIAGDHLTIAEMMEIMSKVLGKEIMYSEISWEHYRGLGFPGVEDLSNMFQFYHDCSDKFLAARSLEETRKLNPELLNFEQWVAKHKAEFRLP